MAAVLMQGRSSDAVGAIYDELEVFLEEWCKRHKIVAGDAVNMLLFVTASQVYDVTEERTPDEWMKIAQKVWDFVVREEAAAKCQ